MSTTSQTVSYPRSGTRNRAVQLDGLLMLAVAGILLISAVMVASSSISIAARETGDSFYYFKRQLIFIVAGVIACGVVVRIPTTLWERFRIPLLLIAFGLLIAVLIPGVGAVVNGSRRWINLGFTRFQPSELSRVFILIFIAGYAAKKQQELKKGWQAATVPVGVLGVAAGLLLLEPDMGAVIVLGGVGIAILFVAGMQWRYFIGLVTGCAALVTVLIVFEPYRWKRVTGFLNPFDDPFGTGFQLVQSLIAIGRGELFGVGLGASVQKLSYLPEAHTDFVFAVLAEEFGFIGVLCVLGLFGLLVWRVLVIARAAAEANLPFQAYVATSFGVWVGLQAFFNIGVNMGILPTKGLTLPMLSNGGTSLLVALFWLGIVLRIGHESNLSGRSALPKKGKA